MANKIMVLYAKDKKFVNLANLLSGSAKCVNCLVNKNQGFVKCDDCMKEYLEQIGFQVDIIEVKE